MLPVNKRGLGLKVREGRRKKKKKITFLLRIKEGTTMKVRTKSSWLFMAFFSLTLKRVLIKRSSTLPFMLHRLQ